MSNEVISARSDVSPAWLGYPTPEAPYTQIDTIRFPIRDIASGIDLLLERYPLATLDLVCHSFQGTVAAYWAVRQARSEKIQSNVPKVLHRVRSITTINSPLSGADKYLRIFNIIIKPQLENIESLVPSGLNDLQGNSRIMKALQQHANQPSPVDYLITIGTQGDRLVTSDDSRLPYATKCPLIEGVLPDPPDDKLSIHTAVLWHNDLIENIVESLLTLPS